jgi:hypothetical protein
LGRVSGFPPTVFAQAHSFLTHPPLSNVPGQNARLLSYCMFSFPFPRLPPHDRGRCWTPGRPAVASVILPARRSLLVQYHCSRSDPPSPDTQVPHFNSPCRHSVSLSPPAQPGRRAKPRDQRVVLSHTRPARSPLPGRARVHHRLLCEERNHRDTSYPTTYTA